VDSLKIAELFPKAEAWEKILRPVLERQPRVSTFIGPERAASMVPLREMTFQALLPNPPEAWKVIAFGQNPYPRVESATGIAMFDNSFKSWADSRFGKVVSMRCLIKAACIAQHGLSTEAKIPELRALLEKQSSVSPPEWFSALLAQGVLLLNAALTASADGSLSTNEHTAFWRPVVRAILEAIFEARAKSGQGLVFLWWGSHAKALRSEVDSISRRYSKVAVAHIEHCNPAAQGDLFCKKNHFGEVNSALKKLNLEPVDWMPGQGWQGRLSSGTAEAARMEAFIEQTMSLHELYLERLQSVKDEGQVELLPISGIFAGPRLSFDEALAPLRGKLRGLESAANQARSYASKKHAGGLSADEVGAIHLYTLESDFYRRLNESLRDQNRSLIQPYFGLLRLILEAMRRLPGSTEPLWRGVRVDLSRAYPKGKTITWWGVSSCTPRREVATNFLGGRGARTLFRIRPRQAVSIRQYSAFEGEEEFLMAPGTQLEVFTNRKERDGLVFIELVEKDGAPLIS
jgi:uracil DNA glycosylase